MNAKDKKLNMFNEKLHFITLIDKTGKSIVNC
jgi:hypothetical protein